MAEETRTDGVTMGNETDLTELSATAAEVEVSPTEEHATDRGFGGRTAAEIVGITYRQLDYWARTDLVRPRVVDAAGSGSRRRYSYRDLLELRVVKSLLDSGIRLQTVRQVFTFLREHLDEDVASANLVINGPQSIVVRSGDELIDIVRNGQGVLNILPLSGVKRDVDAAILAFPDRPAGDSGSIPGGGGLQQFSSAAGSTDVSARAGSAIGS